MPSDQCLATSGLLKWPAALPFRGCGTLGNASVGDTAFSSAMAARNTCTETLSPARPPRIASAPGSLQANGSHSCCVHDSMQTAQRANRHLPDLESHRVHKVDKSTMGLIAVGLFGRPRLQLPNPTLALHPHLPAAVFVPFLMWWLRRRPARPSRKRSGQRYKCQLWGRGRGCLYLYGTPETNRRRRVKSPLPNREPRAARSQAPQPWQPCSVSRAPKPTLDWQPVAERQRQRDLQEGRVEKRRGRSHTHVLFLPTPPPPKSAPVAERVGDPGGTARDVPVPPPFPSSHAGTNRHLVSFGRCPAHQSSLCWMTSVLVDKIRSEPRAVCHIGQDGWSAGKTFANPKWGMGRRAGSSENGPASASGFRLQGRVWGRDRRH